MRVQHVVVDFLDVVNVEPEADDPDEPTVALGLRLARRFHRECNYKVTENGTLVVYPTDGRTGRDDPRLGPVGGYAPGVWRRYWYEYLEEPEVNVRG